MLKERNIKIYVENVRNLHYGQKSMNAIALLPYISTFVSVITSQSTKRAMAMFIIGLCASLYFTFKINDIFNLEKNTRSRKLAFISGLVWLYAGIMFSISACAWMAQKAILFQYNIHFKVIFIFLYFILCCVCQLFYVREQIKKSNKSNIGDIHLLQRLSKNIGKSGYIIFALLVSKTIQQQIFIYIILIMIAASSLSVKFFLNYFFIIKIENSTL